MWGREAGAQSKGERANLLLGLLPLRRSGDHGSSRAHTQQLDHIKNSVKARSLRQRPCSFSLLSGKRNGPNTLGKGCNSNEMQDFIHVSLERLVILIGSAQLFHKTFSGKKKVSLISKQCMISRHLLEFSQFILLEVVNVTLPKVEETVRIFPLEFNSSLKHFHSVLKALSI